eukprot:CAMPEP_0176474124 /NCGR_PEP_ID=MMETSP0127-20121128/42785_1 /TAXON_ID=938130 /ORGANISM="Platyophrya macrostoma, Strain WH" /LENGTH=86 /DNA_ID=CAMNT_0017869391 /DNA_START=1 /DNA_END=261 /DNA_ORIENTATION=+
MSGSSQSIQWVPLPGGWTRSSDATQNRLTVDSRYYAEAGGPLLCTALFFGPSCFVQTNATTPVYVGPELYFMSGYGLNAVYDGNCN